MYSSYSGKNMTHVSFEVDFYGCKKDMLFCVFKYLEMSRIMLLSLSLSLSQVGRRFRYASHIIIFLTGLQKYKRLLQAGRVVGLKQHRFVSCNIERFLLLI